MSIQNRKTVRGTLKTDLETDLTALQAVYAYYPKDFGGQSPVCTIESLPILINLETARNYQNYDFAVTFWARCDGETGSGLTASDAEDKLDDLHYALCQTLSNRYNAEFIQPSDPVQYEQESGAIYQSEMHYVRISRP